MRGFFHYYGGKWRAVGMYPKPSFDTIVEPFAGAAGYSTVYYDRNIVLCDLDPVVFGVWSFLINAGVRDITSLPDVQVGQSVDDLKVCQEARWLIGFWLNAGVAAPCKTPSRWMGENRGVGRGKLSGGGAFWGPRVRLDIASQIRSIKHWKVFNCSYADCPVGGRATWFVDPPYQMAGKYYRCSSDDVDFPALGTWCREREGQAIVCENAGADWLPFRPLGDIVTPRHTRSVEVIWTNEEKL